MATGFPAYDHAVRMGYIRPDDPPAAPKADLHMTTAQVRQLLRDEKERNGQLKVKVWMAFAPGVGHWHTCDQDDAERMLARVTSDWRYHACWRYHAWVENPAEVWIEYLGD